MRHGMCNKIIEALYRNKPKKGNCPLYGWSQKGIILILFIFIDN